MIMTPMPPIWKIWKFEKKSKTIPGKIVEEVVDGLSFGILGKTAGKAVDEYFDTNDSDEK